MTGYWFCGRSCTCTEMTLPQAQSSPLQVATIEQQLAQERQTVLRLDGTATQLQQEIDNQKSSLEEQGQCRVWRQRAPPDGCQQGDSVDGDPARLWARTSSDQK